MGITLDNASNNNIFMCLLATWSIEKSISFDSNFHFRCFAHVINLAVVFRPGLLTVKRFDPLRKISIRVETGLKFFNSVSYRVITGITFIITGY